MKKLIALFVAIFFLVASSAYAGSSKKIINNTTNVTNVTNVSSSDKDEEVYGLKLDAPNLVKLNEDWSIGSELSKDLNDTNADEGWSYFAKVTYFGSWFDFTKKEESTK